MRLERIAMPNADPAFVEALAGIVRRELRAVRHERAVRRVRAANGMNLE